MQLKNGEIDSRSYTVKPTLNFKYNELSGKHHGKLHSSPRPTPVGAGLTAVTVKDTNTAQEQQAPKPAPEMWK